MARYPSFEEYEKTGKYADGIKRCDDLLKKNPDDHQLLITKLKCLAASKGNIAAVVEQLLSIQPPITDFSEIAVIETAVVQSQRDVYPPPNTAGPEVTRLWETAFKATTSVNQRLDLQSCRFANAVLDNRVLDAQQALIQLKVLQPKNRIVYMAHAAVTQLLSTSKEDLQSRLALSLARKAVKERFDDDASLDCRVPGQIFALQESAEDLESIADRPRFKESKQVYLALRKAKPNISNGVPTENESQDPTTLPGPDWLSSETESLKKRFAELIQADAHLEAVLIFAANAIRLFHTSMTRIKDIRGRATADACFLSISALVRAFEQTSKTLYLLQAAYLAEMLLHRDSHVHEARLVLVYIYMRLGLGSLAVRLFDSLAVKEIQHDTVGHALFTGLSLVHPHSLALDKKTPDPIKRTSHALSVYTRHEEKLAENEAAILNHGQTGMIFDLQELRQSLRTSLARRITLLERRRLDRLLHSTAGEDTAQMGPKVLENWTEVEDNRDLRETFDFGYAVEEKLYGHDGKLPGKGWILYALAADLAWCLAMNFPLPIDHSSDKLLDEIRKVSLDVDSIRLEDEDVPALGMSRAEYLAGDLACRVLKLQTAVATNVTDVGKDIDAVSDAIERLPIKLLLETNDAYTAYLKDCFANADVLRITVKACDAISIRVKEKETSAKIRKIHDLAKNLFKAIQYHANHQSANVKAPNIKKLMEQDGAVWEAIKVFGEGSVKSLTEEVAKSAVTGWVGLAKIRMV